MTGWRSVTTGVILVCGVAMTLVEGRAGGSSRTRAGGVGDGGARRAVIYTAKPLSEPTPQRSLTADTVRSSAPDQARSVRDATEALLRLTKEQLGTLSVVQANDMRSLLREAQGYILSTHRLLDGEPL
jgi:hypothetical protein